jgi:hypothetical protein
VTLSLELSQMSLPLGANPKGAPVT